MIFIDEVRKYEKVVGRHQGKNEFMLFSLRRFIVKDIYGILECCSEQQRWCCVLFDATWRRRQYDSKNTR